MSKKNKKRDNWIYLLVIPVIVSVIGGVIVLMVEYGPLSGNATPQQGDTTIVIIDYPEVRDPFPIPIEKEPVINADDSNNENDSKPAAVETYEIMIIHCT